MDGTDVIFVREELCTCRVCLATDVRLEVLYPGLLAETYEQLTGIPVSPTDGLPQHLCSMCAALLKKSAAFRYKCCNTHDFLQRVRKRLQPLGAQLAKVEISMSLIRNLDRKYLKLPYITTNMLNISILGDGDSGEKGLVVPSNELLRELLRTNVNLNKNEIHLKQETQTELKEESEDNYKLNDYCDEAPDCIITDEELVKEEEILIDINMTEIVNPTPIAHNDNDSKLENNHVTTHKDIEKNEDQVDLHRFRIRKLKCGDGRFTPKENLDEFAKTYNFDVIILTRNEQILELERSRKNSLLYKHATLKCEECFRGFKSKTAYKNHMVVHDPISGCHVCLVCRHRYPTLAKLNIHTRQHKMKYVCRECSRSFTSSMLAREHYNTHTGVSYECKHCGVRFKKYGSRLNHIRIHHGATVCDICYEGFQGARGLLQHKAKAHKQAYQCASCDVHFDNAHAMIKHMGSSPDGACDPNIRACAKCGELCATDEQFDEHVARVHAKSPNQRKRWNSEKPVTYRRCCTCPHFEPGKTGDREHNVPNSYSCPCGDSGDVCLCPSGSARSCKKIERSCSSSQVGVFLRHGLAHKQCCEERRLRKTQVMCEMCAKTFRSDFLLRVHQRVHTGEKPFECNECSKRFRVKSSLQIHMNTHTGERPFKCSFCPKAYNTPRSRYNHQLAHTKERRYRCEVCGKTFQTSTTVKMHVRTVHMKVPRPRRARNTKRKRQRTDTQ